MEVGADGDILKERHAQASRHVQRPFKLHWGGGMIVEEVSMGCEYHEPCIQLLEFDEGYERFAFAITILKGYFNEVR